MIQTTKKVWQPPMAQPATVPGVACRHKVLLTPGDMMYTSDGVEAYWLQYLEATGSYTHFVLDTRTMVRRVLTERERWNVTAILVQKHRKEV